MKRVDVVARNVDEVREMIPKEERDQYKRRMSVINWGVANLTLDWYKGKMSEEDFNDMLEDEGLPVTKESVSEDKFKEHADQKVACVFKDVTPEEQAKLDEIVTNTLRALVGAGTALDQSALKGGMTRCVLEKIDAEGKNEDKQFVHNVRCRFEEVTPEEQVRLDEIVANTLKSIVGAEFGQNLAPFKKLEEDEFTRYVNEKVNEVFTNVPPEDHTKLDDIASKTLKELCGEETTSDQHALDGGLAKCVLLKIDKEGEEKDKQFISDVRSRFSEVTPEEQKQLDLILRDTLRYIVLSGAGKNLTPFKKSESPNDQKKVSIIKSRMDQVKAMIPEATRSMYDTEDKIIDFALKNLPEEWYVEETSSDSKNFFNVDFDVIKIQEVADLTIDEKSYLCRLLDYVELYIYGSELSPSPSWHPRRNQQVYELLDTIMRPDNPTVKFCLEKDDPEFVTNTLELYKKIIYDFDTGSLRNAGAKLCRFTRVFFEIIRASAGMSYVLAADWADQYCERRGSSNPNILLGAYCAYAMEVYAYKHLESDYITTSDTMIEAAIPMILGLRKNPIGDTRKAVQDFRIVCKELGFDYDIPMNTYRYNSISEPLGEIQALVSTTATDISISALRCKLRNLVLFSDTSLEKYEAAERMTALSKLLENGKPFEYNEVYKYLAYLVTSYLGVNVSGDTIGKFAYSIHSLQYSCFLDSTAMIDRLLQDISANTNECVKSKMTDLYPLLCNIVHNRSYYPLCVLYAGLSKKKIDLLNISEETKSNLTLVPLTKITESISKLLSPEYHDGLVHPANIYTLLTTLRDAIDVTMAFIKNSSGYESNEYMDLRRIQTIVCVALGASEECKFDPSIVFGDTSKLDEYEEYLVNRIGSIVVEAFKCSESAVKPAYISELSSIPAKRTTSFSNVELMVVDILCSFWKNGYEGWLSEFESSLKLSQNLVSMLED